MNNLLSAFFDYIKQKNRCFYLFFFLYIKSKKRNNKNTAWCYCCESIRDKMSYNTLFVLGFDAAHSMLKNEYDEGKSMLKGIHKSIEKEHVLNAET